MRGDIVRWTARRMPGIDDAVRGELVESAGAAADRGGPLGRVLEVGSLMAFALRSMSRQGAFDDRREMVRQGLRVGALVLALATALRTLAAAHDAPSARLAGAACVTAIAIAGGLRVIAILAAAVTVAVEIAATGSPNVWSLVVLAAVAFGHRFDARRCPTGGVVCAAALAAGGIVQTPSSRHRRPLQSGYLVTARFEWSMRVTRSVQDFRALCGRTASRLVDLHDPRSGEVMLYGVGGPSTGRRGVELSIQLCIQSTGFGDARCAAMSVTGGVPLAAVPARTPPFPPRSRPSP